MINILKPQPVRQNFSIAAGHLLCFLDYARNNTINVVHNCTIAQLDFVAEEEGNSTGTLLRHIAALEYQFQRVTFFNSHLSESDITEWYGAYAPLLSMNNVNNQPLKYYIDLLEKQRKTTISLFADKTDEWLLADNQLLPKANNLFFWYHLAEDELSHTGQIKLILKKQAKVAGNINQQSFRQAQPVVDG